MKKIFLTAFFVFNLNAQLLQLDKIRTDLYSKNGVNTLKKVELSLELDGDNLKENKNKLIDSINTVISGFFYEDIFTEIGKNNFKKTLKKFADKKYKIKLEDIYILSLVGIEKFDIEELKRFLESVEAKENNINNKVKKALENLEIPKIPTLSTPNVEFQQVEQLFKNNKDNYDDTEININNLNIPKITPDIEQKIKQELINNLPQVFEKNNTNNCFNFSKFHI